MITIHKATDEEIERADAAADALLSSAPCLGTDPDEAIRTLLLVLEDVPRVLIASGEDEGIVLGIKLLERGIYAAKHAIGRLEVKRQRQDQEVSLYEAGAKVLLAGLQYDEAIQILHPYYAGERECAVSDDGARYLFSAGPMEAAYLALESLRSMYGDQKSTASHIVRWVSAGIPSDLSCIVESAEVSAERVAYRFDPALVAALETYIHIDATIPEGWEFPWGSAAVTTDILRALMTRCLYHFIAVHGGASAQGVQGGGVDDLLLDLDWNTLVAEVVRLSKRTSVEVERCLGAITFARSLRTPDPALQFVFRFGGRAVVPCIQACTLRLGRNALSLHARVDPKGFDNQSSEFEREMTARLAGKLAARFPGFETNRKIPGNVRAGEVDLVIVEPDSRTVLVGELRWLLTPGDPREVVNKVRECRRKVEQVVRKAKAIDDDLRRCLKTWFGIDCSEGLEDWSVHAVVVVEGFAGVADGIRAGIPMVPVEYFSSALQEVTSLEEFVELWKSGRWLPREGYDYSLTQQCVELGGITLQEDKVTFGAEPVVERDRSSPLSPEFDPALELKALLELVDKRLAHRNGYMRIGGFLSRSILEKLPDWVTAAPQSIPDFVTWLRVRGELFQLGGIVLDGAESQGNELARRIVGQMSLDGKSSPRQRKPRQYLSAGEGGVAVVLAVDEAFWSARWFDGP